MEQDITPMNTGLKYGIILGLLSIVLSLSMHYGGLNNYDAAMSTSKMMAGALPLILVFLVIYVGIKFLRENNDGLLSFGQGLSTAMFIGIFSGILLAIFTYVFFAYMEPDLMSEIMENALEDQDLSDDAMRQAQSFSGMFTSPTFLSISAFISRMFGALIMGLIASAILKKD